ncbi:MAG: PD-(D/E)XK nuclease family transposase [Eubacteriales bacterium]
MNKDSNDKDIPQLISYEEFLHIIAENQHLATVWKQLSETAQLKFKSYYEGNEFPNITSDVLFKHIFNPSYHPKRLSELLSLLIQKEVTVVESLPLENIRDTKYAKQIILDIVVRLEDGSLANVEIQRESYGFTPERGAVLSANLLTRQYATLKEQQKSEVNYTKVKPVYTIVILEKEYPYFKTHTQDYIHHFHQMSDTGVQLELLQHYTFVELGKFQKIHSSLQTKLETWLAFLLTKTPKDMLHIISKDFTFQSIYNDVTMFLNSQEEMIMLFYEQIRIMDDNLVKQHIREREELVAEQELILLQQKDEIKEQAEKLVQQKDKLSQQKDELSQSEYKLSQQKDKLSQQEDKLSQQDIAITKITQEKQLYEILILQKRFQDLERISLDEDFKNRLLKELVDL